MKIYVEFWVFRMHKWYLTLISKNVSASLQMTCTKANK